MNVHNVVSEAPASITVIQTYVHPFPNASFVATQAALYQNIYIYIDARPAPWSINAV